jgi:hypothetical protein
MTTPVDPTPAPVPGAHYQQRWRRAWCAVLIAAVALAAWQWSPGAVVLGLFLDSLVVAFVYLLLVSALRCLPDSVPHGRRGIPLRSLLVVSAVLGFSAVAALSLPLAVVGAGAAGLTSPVALSWFARRSRRAHPSGTESRHEGDRGREHV